MLGVILGGIDALTGTLYGRLLIAKVGLFLLMLAFAGVNRFVLTASSRLQILKMPARASSFIAAARSRSASPFSASSACSAR
jgi:putative copper export protein